jgi:hypothetical protein
VISVERGNTKRKKNINYHKLNLYANQCKQHKILSQQHWSVVISFYLIRFSCKFEQEKQKFYELLLFDMNQE